MFAQLIRPLCRIWLRRPGLLILLTLLASIPAGLQVRKIRLDTDLSRLLPTSSRAVLSGRELEKVVGGDGGYFSVIFEGSDRAALDRAVDRMAQAAAALPNVQSVESRSPVEFIRHYRYLLVPSRTLAEVSRLVDRLEAEVNPLLVDLEAEGPGGEEKPKPDSSDLESKIERYLDLPERSVSPDGRLMGLIIRPQKGITSLGATRQLFRRMTQLAEEAAGAQGVTAWVSGSNRNKVDIYDQIRQDLNRSGTLAGLGILLVLMVAYRSVRILPVVLLPIGLGLLWSYALVPVLVGDLNTITSFLLMVLFGTGVEFAVHLVMRFQAELGERGLEDALFETFRSTGRSIVTSGLATTFGMAVLIFSRFRGFSEFGIIAATAIVAIFGSMFVALPPLLVLGARFKLVQPRAEGSGRLSFVPPAWVTAGVFAVAVLAAAVALLRLGFDYDFTRLQPEIPAAEAAKSRHRAVYPGFTVPGAFYVARDLPALDAALEVLDKRRQELGEGGILGTASSVRDFAPSPGEFRERVRLLGELRERLSAAWTRKVKDEKKRRWIRDLADFEPPPAAPTVDELPPEIRGRFVARDGSGEWLIALDVIGRSRDGRTAMAFTREVYGLPMPAGVRGPTGDKPVLAEILWLVTEEGPWLVGLALLGIVLLVFLDRKSLVQTVWVLVPLLAGLVLSLGLLALIGGKLNFFNIVVLPNLIGNAVDNGVHYVRRWLEMGRDIAAVQGELAEALSASALTTIMGYAGLLAAHHAGLRSIGALAVLGLGCCWFTGVVLMPGLLAILGGRSSRRT